MFYNQKSLLDTLHPRQLLLLLQFATFPFATVIPETNRWFLITSYRRNYRHVPNASAFYDEHKDNSEPVYRPSLRLQIAFNSLNPAVKHFVTYVCSRNFSGYMSDVFWKHRLNLYLNLKFSSDVLKHTFYTHLYIISCCNIHKILSRPNENCLRSSNPYPGCPIYFFCKNVWRQ